ALVHLPRLLLRQDAAGARRLRRPELREPLARDVDAIGRLGARRDGEDQAAEDGELDEAVLEDGAHPARKPSPSGQLARIGRLARAGRRAEIVCQAHRASVASKARTTAEPERKTHTGRLGLRSARVA